MTKVSLDRRLWQLLVGIVFLGLTAVVNIILTVARNSWIAEN